MNLPNSLTILRIFFIPLLVVVLLTRQPNVVFLSVPMNFAVWGVLILLLAAAGIHTVQSPAEMGHTLASVIETPPKDRLAIQTVVAPFSEATIRRAIVEELDRGGQVFFVHNRVESIYSMAALIQKLVPKARVV